MLNSMSKCKEECQNLSKYAKVQGSMQKCAKMQEKLYIVYNRAYSTKMLLSAQKYKKECKSIGKWVSKSVQK